MARQYRYAKGALEDTVEVGLTGDPVRSRQHFYPASILDNIGPHVTLLLVIAISPVISFVNANPLLSLLYISQPRIRYPPFMKPVCQLGFVFVFPVFHLLSRWCHNILTLLPNTTPLRYYQGSDSSTCHQRQRSPCLSRLAFLMFRPQPRYAPDP